MDFKNFLAELEKNNLPDDHEITFTISDFAEVMHYTGEYLDDAMRKTDFIDSVCTFLLDTPFFDKEHETVKELLESDVICDFEAESISALQGSLPLVSARSTRTLSGPLAPHRSTFQAE